MLLSTPVGGCNYLAEHNQSRGHFCGVHCREFVLVVSGQYFKALVCFPFPLKFVAAAKVLLTQASKSLDRLNLHPLARAGDVKAANQGGRLLWKVRTTSPDLFSSVLQNLP